MTLISAADPPPPLPFCEFANIFGAGAPPYYVAYELDATQTITIDGSLDDAAWKDVAFTDSNPDICGTPGPDGFCNLAGTCAVGGERSHGCATPRFSTRQKIRWDGHYLYVAAKLEEPMVWANNTAHQSVIFSDNDYEVFISPDGSNHYYKEYEMNARGVWWDLCLNKPYSNGGYENSTRVFPNGWDDPGVKTAAKAVGCEVNDGSGTCKGWTLEIAFPLAAISLNNTNALPVKAGQKWRINFSRVEWKAHIEGSVTKHNRHYVLGDKAGDGSCDWPCPSGCAQNPGDNWLWAPLGIVDVHQPERWGYLQFASGAVNETAVERDTDWEIRSIAMQLYYAEKAYFVAENTSRYSSDVRGTLADLAPLGRRALNGTCGGDVPTVVLSASGSRFVGSVRSSDGKRVATITDDRYLLVRDAAWEV